MTNSITEPLSCQKGLFELPDDVSYLNCAYMSPLSKKVVAAGEIGILKKTQPYKISTSDFFEPVDNGTQFTTSGVVDLKSFKFTKMLVKRNVYRQIKNDMMTLKNVLENGG